ncbi:hypothetical protein [Kitasatospora purpeofusca]|uniref:hypothetical protein n=1 Tax=Kitasatospora purpeofusca TaxID=67352 RepID=UPI003866579D
MVDGVVVPPGPDPAAFPPGLDWQYSNTNYVLIGVIIEKASRTRCGSTCRSGDNTTASAVRRRPTADTFTPPASPRRTTDSSRRTSPSTGPATASYTSLKASWS